MSSSKWGAFMRCLGKNLIYGVPVTVTFLDFFGYVAKVEGISMQPALNPDDHETNDYVLLNKMAIRDFEVEHGDIVALTCPKNPNQKLIKRVIAVEGETVRSTARGRYVSIPTGHCWVEGDHAAHSMDSNFFGPVSMGLIFAKASHIVWPPSRWQRLEPHLPNERKVIPWSHSDSQASWVEE